MNIYIYRWVAQMVAMATTLSADMQQQVEALKKKIGFAHPVIAMQVRHGDSCVVRPDCFGLHVYMERAMRMQEKYGVRNIYLATDSYKVVAQTKKYEPQFRFMVQPFDRRHFEIPRSLGSMVIDECHMTGQCDPIEDIRTMALDMALMVESDMFIGGFSTNVARVVYEAMAARKRKRKRKRKGEGGGGGKAGGKGQGKAGSGSDYVYCYPPFATVDVPWCHNNGQPMGSSHLNENNTKWAGASC
jgi:hypothetical protein